MALRILQVCTGNLYGGVETVMINMAQARAAYRDLVCEYSVCFEGSFKDQLAATGVTVHSIPSARLRNPLSVWRARKVFAEVVKNGNFNAAIFHSSWSHAIFGPVAKAQGLASIPWIHGVPHRRNFTDWWANRVGASFVICNSKHTMNRLTRHYFPYSPRKCFYNPIPMARVRDARMEVRRELGTDPDRVVIFQASRMEDWKGHRTLIGGLASIKDLPNWECWIAGAPQQESERRYFASLQELASRHGVNDKVRFLGHRGDIPRLLAGADIFCQPNLGPEPFGNVFVEALAAGLPVVSTAIGGAQEIVTPSCGLLVRPGADDLLGSCLATLILNPDMRQRLSEGGPKRARELSDPRRQLRYFEYLIGLGLAEAA